MNWNQVEKIVASLDKAGLLTDKQKARDVLKEAFQDEIHIVWSVGDVQTIAPSLSDDEARDVLEEVDRRHDAEIGVNWDILREFAGSSDDNEEEEDDEEDEDEFDPDDPKWFEDNDENPEGDGKDILG